MTEPRSVELRLGISKFVDLSANHASVLLMAVCMSEVEKRV